MLQKTLAKLHKHNSMLVFTSSVLNRDFFWGGRGGGGGRGQIWSKKSELSIKTEIKYFD